jgi:probable HAF family extracellular repeat protein
MVGWWWGTARPARGSSPSSGLEWAGSRAWGHGLIGQFGEGGASGVSSDGSVIVGSAETTFFPGTIAFRSLNQGNLEALGDLPGGALLAITYGVSTDGTVVVGRSESTLGFEAFRWTASGGMQGLGDLAGGSFSSTAYAASANGEVIVGDGQSAAGQEPFRWTSAGGMVGLGLLPGDTGGFGSSVSADGSVVVGLSSDGLTPQAFRWTSAGGMVGLGDLPGGAFWSVAHDVSADGSVVVGDSTGATGGGEAFIWDAVHGMRRLETVLENEHGLDLTGWSLWDATSISADGRTIVGTGQNPDGFTEGWVAVLPAAPAVPALGRTALAALIALLLLAALPALRPPSSPAPPWSRGIPRSR